MLFQVVGTGSLRGLDLWRLECPPGTSANGMSSCRACPAGRYCPGGMMQPQACPIGTYSYGSALKSTDCLPCPVGHYCPDPTDAIQCPAGTFQSTQPPQPTLLWDACRPGKQCIPRNIVRVQERRNISITLVLIGNRCSNYAEPHLQCI